MPETVTTRSIPRTVWALGFVSLFMDLSSEMVHGLLPVFLVGTLGVSMITLGFIEGIAEATTLIVKVFSGAISDHFGKRKSLLLLGYGLAALTKPLFPFPHFRAYSWPSPWLFDCCNPPPWPGPISVEQSESGFSFFNLSPCRYSIGDGLIANRLLCM